MEATKINFGVFPIVQSVSAGSPKADICFGGEFSPFGKKHYGERKKNVKNFPFKKNCLFFF